MEEVELDPHDFMRDSFFIKETPIIRANKFDAETMRSDSTYFRQLRSK
jgi:hypothetical protein